MSNKVLVFQSDDWGSERMPSKSVFDRLKNESWLNVQTCPYTSNDTLESKDDVERLASLLLGYKDINGNHPVLTLNFNVSNPDFSLIRESDFQRYFSIPLEETYQRNNKGDLISTVKKGVLENVFDVQYHGKQHVNPKEYLRILQIEESSIRKVFDYDIYALSYENATDINSPYLATYYPFGGYDRIADFKDGIDLFDKAFGNKPSSFIAPVYIWNKDLEFEAVRCGVKNLQGLYYRYDYEQEVRRKYYRYGSSYNKPLNVIRNCFLEPTTKPNYDWLANCLYEIGMAFRYGRPAIVCTHRLNYVSGISSSNADRGLELLDNLLGKALEKWPDIQFKKTSDLIKV